MTLLVVRNLVTAVPVTTSDQCRTGLRMVKFDLVFTACFCLIERTVRIFKQ